MTQLAHVTVQLSHPHDEDEMMAALRAEGITPVLVNGQLVTGTTEAHLQQALDQAGAIARTEGIEQQIAFRRLVVESLAHALETRDMTNAPEDAVILLAIGLVEHGYRDADALPFCAARFERADVSRAILTQRPATP